MLERAGGKHELLDFSPYGYDERQYCSPGFDLAVGCFMRTPHGRYPEYHTSGDDLAFVSPESLADTFAKVRDILEVVDQDARFVNQNPKCEPQLGKRGLYTAVRGGALPDYEFALLWVLNLSDGRHSLLDIAERSHMPFGAVRQAAEALVAHGLLRPEHTGA